MGLRFLSGLFTMLILMWNPLPVEAHRVNIFAWVEGGMIYTQSKFSGGRPAKNADILVLDEQGNLLLEGKTDADGEFSFPAPDNIELRIVLKASMGHTAEWVITSQEIALLPEPDSKIDEFSEVQVYPSALSEPSACLTKEEIQHIINESLDIKLAALNRVLNKMSAQRPGLTEIIGGIGYIMGLVGIMLYIKSRNKGTQHC